MSHSSGLELFHPDGTLRTTFRFGLRARGAVEVCDAHILALVEKSTTSNAIVRIRSEVSAVDTVEVFESVRRNSRTYHPWFAVADQTGMLAYFRVIRQLRSHGPGELGLLLGLDRAPEEKTVRRKLKELAAHDKAVVFGRSLAERWADEYPEVRPAPPQRLPRRPAPLLPGLPPARGPAPTVA